jgi:hypothetical protein
MSARPNCIICRGSSLPIISAKQRLLGKYPERPAFLRRQINRGGGRERTYRDTGWRGLGGVFSRANKASARAHGLKRLFGRHFINSLQNLPWTGTMAQGPGAVTASPTIARLGNAFAGLATWPSAANHLQKATSISLHWANESSRTPRKRPKSPERRA